MPFCEVPEGEGGEALAQRIDRKRFGMVGQVTGGTFCRGGHKAVPFDHEVANCPVIRSAGVIAGSGSYVPFKLRHAEAGDMGYALKHENMDENRINAG